MKFQSVYERSINQQGLQPDRAQLGAVEKMSDLFFNLSKAVDDNKKLITIIKRLLTGAGHQNVHQGCYLWGGVGRGKTWLMDMFYDAVPCDNKVRFHYQHFMQQVHVALAQLNGRQDPLVSVAKRILKQSKLICLDEFHVLDITDAMLLYGLLDALYKMGAVFVMTSNLPPDKLYLNGLQRERFMPAIELIKNNNLIIECNGDRDYRLNGVTNAGNYFTPLTDETLTLLRSKFSLLAPSMVEAGKAITVNNRTIQTQFHAAEIVWFNFNDLCAGPRAASDYIEIARRYPVVFLSDVYQMDDFLDDVARRFINLIDEFYDHGTTLIISSNYLPRYLYIGKRLVFEFERTVSRLEEMRSLPC
ncbi:MAG: cell division protein ZapE [Gammaproteobacteria bacterium]|nr:cell division protein ZapE [Gammaproteobacteria bacterium]